MNSSRSPQEQSAYACSAQVLQERHCGHDRAHGLDRASPACSHHRGGARHEPRIGARRSSRLWQQRAPNRPVCGGPCRRHRGSGRKMRPRHRRRHLSFLPRHPLCDCSPHSSLPPLGAGVLAGPITPQSWRPLVSFRKSTHCAAQRTWPTTPARPCWRPLCGVGEAPSATRTWRHCSRVAAFESSSDCERFCPVRK